jgi:hypothetical protein
MTKRSPVSGQKNVWSDAQQVDDSDLTLEQQYNDTIDSSIINNHIGTGILPEVLVQNILFDSALTTGFLDGVAVYAQNQPADSNLGNNLEISLQNSLVAGRKSIKVAVIGLDFQSNLQYETFYFKTNEAQVSKKHFTKILLLLFNDFIGDPNVSFNLGGHLVIKEARSMTLSRDPIMVSQDVQPNLFFRDFFATSPSTLQALLTNALPLYNINSLGISTSPLDEKVLSSGDVTTQIGEKFLASTNNIQKITLLMSVRNLTVGQSTDYAWNGDLVVSIYPLQSSIQYSTDILPSTPIDYSPLNVPIAQVSINYTTLQAAGITLNSVPQPVDFVFSNSPVAAGTVLTPGSYYAITAKRSGSANKCDLMFAVGATSTPNSRITTFTGSLWVDIPEEQLWFQVWNDSAKVSDGQAYESGHGITIPKTNLDTTTQATVDYSLNALQFVGNDVYRAVVAATTLENTPVPDQRTGSPVNSRQQFVPSVNLLNTIDITNLEATTDPLLIGAITDKNRKFFDSISSTINAKLYSATFVNNELLIRIVDDPTDTARYDTSVISLQSNLLNGDLQGALLIPNYNNPTTYYKVADAKLYSMILGDVNGDGVVDSDDLDLLNSYIGYDLTTGLPLHTTYSTDGYHATYKNGYLTYNKPFVNQFSVHFQLIDPTTNIIVVDGYDGVLVANPNDPRLAQFTSASVMFSSIFGLSGYKLMVLTPSVDYDYGAFDIISVDVVSDVLTIRKVILTGDTVAQLLRADIDGDFHVSNTDGYILNSYINKIPLSSSQTTTYPAPATNQYTKIGTTFNVIRLKLEQYVDRFDDYTTNPNTRATSLHPVPDIFYNDGYFASHNLVTYPSQLSFQKKLTWDESLVMTNSNAKFVPSIFTTLNGYVGAPSTAQPAKYTAYATQPSFDPGRVDYYVPNNLIIGSGGELQRPDGYFYKVDFEVGTVVLEIPDGLFGSERTINIFDDFIADYTGAGITRLGFPSMRFSDSTLVGTDALSKDQLRFSVSIQSFSPNTNGLSTEGYSGAIVDGKIGLAIDYATGLLTLNFTNLYQDAVLQSLSTKVQVSVFLKKGGFNNQPLFVDSSKVQNMLKLVSVFSGANEGGPSALVDLANDVTGILPLIHGGTGLNTVGASGTVLASNGSGLSYQFITDLTSTIAFSTGTASANKLIKTDGYGFIDPSFMYKNPVYICALAGVQSNGSATPIAIGAFTFRFDSFILEGLSTIKLEAVLETTNASDAAGVQLYNVNTASYLNINGGSQYITTNAISPTLVRSSDIKSLLSAGATDYVYEIHLSLNPTSGSDIAICKMARLVLTYNNLTLNGSSQIAPPLSHSTNFVPFLPSPTPS